MVDVVQRYCENSILGDIQSSARQVWTTWLKWACFEKRFGLGTSDDPFWPTLPFDSMLHYLFSLDIIDHLNFLCTSIFWRFVKRFSHMFKEEWLFLATCLRKKKFLIYLFSYLLIFLFTCACWDLSCQQLYAAVLSFKIACILGSSCLSKEIFCHVDNLWEGYFSFLSLHNVDYLRLEWKHLL